MRPPDLPASRPELVQVPGLVPARMLTEYAYCPRLFFLMWVDQLMRDNADVAEGRRRHRRIDHGTGKVPPPGTPELKVARSVELGSDDLGIIAKLDLLEPAPAGEAGVVPVEFKKGHPPPAGGAWEPDTIQVCAQILLLREHGYTCNHGMIFYAATHQRIRVDPTDDLINKTMEVLHGARTTAQRLRPPPPLVSSPRCPRCSLVGICLPDEVNALTARASSPPRRLLASKPDAEPLYVTEQGTMVGVSGGRLVVTYKGERLTTLRLLDILHVCLYGDVQMTAGAIRALIDRGIDLFHFTWGGWLQGTTTGLPGKNVMLRIRQVTAAARADLNEPRRMIAGKIRNQRTLLRRNGGPACAKVVGQLAQLAVAAENVDDAAELLGTEGAAARLYFEHFTHLVPHASALPGPRFSGLRNRRPPTDAVNCLLSFCYALLTKELLAAVMQVGFDPYIGLFHRPRFGRPALALDLAEEFRPLVADSVTITLINTNQLGRTDFMVRTGAVTLTPPGRKTVIRAWEKRMTTELKHPTFGYEVTYRRAMELQARLLAAALIGDAPAYHPLTTR